MTNNESDSSREWASQAYALLKQKQELKKQEVQREEEKKPRSNMIEKEDLKKKIFATIAKN
jgi:fused signal recognition particle receptor